jgi:hypothetical protein
MKGEQNTSIAKQELLWLSYITLIMYLPKLQKKKDLYHPIPTLTAESPTHQQPGIPDSRLLKSNSIFVAVLSD